MPTYEYRCDHCGHTFSTQQRFDDPLVEKCPKCGERPRKLVSRPAIVFKGSGWHVTDYPKRSTESATSGSTAEGATETKPKEGGTTDPKAKDSGAKDSGPKESGAKDSGAKDSGAKDSGAKDSGAKESGAKDARAKGSGSKGTSTGSETS